MKTIQQRKGFTLLEVVVVIAIMVTLVGVMIPFIYRVWENNDIAITRERMRDLKEAMVGDEKLMQNGIRMDYGYVGDNGQLPQAVPNPQFPGYTTVSNAITAYMPAGYDPQNYGKDAWGNDLIYTPAFDTVSGRRVSATMVSAGPDGIPGTADDITDPDLQIFQSEVIPTSAVQGNLNFVFSNSSSASQTPTYMAMVSATYNGPAGLAVTNSGCLPISTGPISANASVPVSQYFSSAFTTALPIGKVLFGSTLYPGSSCTGSGIQSTNTMAVFISDGLNAVSVNLPTITYTLP